MVVVAAALGRVWRVTMLRGGNCGGNGDCGNGWGYFIGLYGTMVEGSVVADMVMNEERRGKSD